MKIKIVEPRGCTLVSALFSRGAFFFVLVAVLFGAFCFLAHCSPSLRCFLLYCTLQSFAAEVFVLVLITVLCSVFCSLTHWSLYLRCFLFSYSSESFSAVFLVLLLSAIFLFDAFCLCTHCSPLRWLRVLFATPHVTFSHTTSCKPSAGIKASAHQKAGIIC